MFAKYPKLITILCQLYFQVQKMFHGEKRHSVFKKFIFGCTGSSSLSVDFSLVAVSCGYSVAVCGLLIVGTSRCRAQALGMQASVVGCSTQAQ